MTVRREVHRDDDRRAQRPRPRRIVQLLAAVALVTVAGCSSDDDRTSAEIPDDLEAERCLVRVHGRSDSGAAPVTHDGWVELAPDANEEFDGGGRVWIYDTPTALAAARSTIADAIDEVGCEQVVLHGFSNGAAFVGALVCDGETFDGRLVGAVIDDPVTDDSSPDCAPDAGVEVAVYRTGALADAGESCAELGWTCAGGDRLVGIEEYARRLGTEVLESPHDDHRPYLGAPEPTVWLGVA